MKNKSFIVFVLAFAACCTHSVAQGRVDSIAARMSVREKVAQLMVVPIDSRNDTLQRSKTLSLVKNEKIGGLIIMGKNCREVAALTNELQSLSELPLLCCIDGEWGVAMRIAEFEAFPKQLELSALGSDSLVYQMGKAVAEECKALKIQVNFAPDIDVNVNPDNIVIGARSFGDDKEKVAAFGSAYMRGMQDGGIVACAKHFPGHGDTSVDSHKGLPVLGFGRGRLDSLELFPFRRLFADGVKMAMVGHLAVPALDSTGVPASASRPIVTGLLREEMNFSGVIVSDALNMKGLTEYFHEDNAAACLEVYKSGMDILLMPLEPVRCLDAIVEWIGEDPDRLEDLAARLARILEMKESLGMLDDGYDRFVDADAVNPGMNAAFVEELKSRISSQKM